MRVAPSLTPDKSVPVSRTFPAEPSQYLQCPEAGSATRRDLNASRAALRCLSKTLVQPAFFIH